MTVPPGKFRVTIRIERPDGQFVIAARDIPADLDDRTEQERYQVTEDIAVEFVKAYGRADRLS